MEQRRYTAVLGREGRDIAGSHRRRNADERCTPIARPVGRVVVPKSQQSPGFSPRARHGPDALLLVRRAGDAAKQDGPFPVEGGEEEVLAIRGPDRQGRSA